MEGAQVHWHAGQGDNERRGGEEGVGLVQRDPEGEVGVRVEKETGETEQELKVSWVTKDSLLGEAVTEGEVDLAKDSDWLRPADDGISEQLVGVVVFLEVAVL